MSSKATVTKDGKGGTKKGKEISKEEQQKYTNLRLEKNRESCRRSRKRRREKESGATERIRFLEHENKRIAQKVSEIPLLVSKLKTLKEINVELREKVAWSRMLGYPTNDSELWDARKDAVIKEVKLVEMSNWEDIQRVASEVYDERVQVMTSQSGKGWNGIKGALAHKKMLRASFQNISIDITSIVPDGMNEIRVSWNTSGYYQGRSPVGAVSEQKKHVCYASVSLVVFKGSKIVRKLTNWDALSLMSQLGPNSSFFVPPSSSQTSQNNSPTSAEGGLSPLQVTPIMQQ